MALQPEGSSYAQKTKKNVTVEKIENQSGWAQQVSQISLEKQLKLATAAANWMEAQGEGKQTERSCPRTNKVLLGNTAELHEDADWPWDIGEEDWDKVE